MAIEWMLSLPRIHLNPAAEDGEKTSLKTRDLNMIEVPRLLISFIDFAFLEIGFGKRKRQLESWR